MSSVVPAVQRQNLAEVAKMLNQISVGRLFGADQPYLTPMNDYVNSGIKDFSRWIYDVIHVEDAEKYFRADVDSLDLRGAQDGRERREPVIYISPMMIYDVHSVLVDHLDEVVSLPFFEYPGWWPIPTLSDSVHRDAATGAWG